MAQLTHAADFSATVEETVWHCVNTVAKTYDLKDQARAIPKHAQKILNIY